jgi:Flp pilus assembly CpaE family ATPase
LSVLEEADLIMAVATPEIPAIKEARLFLDLVGILGMPRERVFFVLNKMDKRSGIAASAVAENLKKPVDAEIPFVEQIVTTSINKGVPLLLGDKSKAPAKNLLDLVALVKERLLAVPVEEEAEEPAAERPRLFAR